MIESKGPLRLDPDAVLRLRRRPRSGNTDGYTRDEAAGRAGLTGPRWSQMESPLWSGNVPVGTLGRMADALGCHPWELLTRREILPCKPKQSRVSKKMTMAVVAQIRRLHADEGLSHRLLADRFHVSISMISSILSGRRRA